jgi:hypothetical protein
MIDIERICREAGGTLTRLATGHGQSGEAWVFHVTDYYEQPTHSLARLCNAVLEEAAKVCDTAAEAPWDETSDRPSVNAGDCATFIRALRVSEKP